ncbi:hypothetical protein FOL47_004583 [Perkinsus chesapeaki]|uniref:Aspartyl/asparaginy/proline hydroxylase domain-containing protein n=1 Tax=Perkinsus chesapeaki TaxID=330153 RepID=A0A7J6N098_PERCH|nr:hypothetical protein FOL47_004583 [Perkinsus chesapeaki]
MVFLLLLLTFFITPQICDAGIIGSLFSMEELHCKDNPHRYPCIEEMKAFKEAGGERGESEVVECASIAVAESDDFYTLRNLTHVLLDMDTIVKVFDHSPTIVRVGIEAARKLTHHPKCLEEFDTKGGLECRCFPLYSKVAMLKYKNYGWWDEAHKYFKEIQGLSYNGIDNPVGWQDIYRTPQIYIPNLRAYEVWPREVWEEAYPIGVALERNYNAILEETKKAMDRDELWEDTYRFLYKNGTWKHLPLYHARKVIEPQCSAMPTLCGLIKKYLPTKPGLPWVVNQNEQVMVIRMDPGTTVETHNGPSNNVLNMHYGIIVPDGALLTVNYTEYRWENGKTIVWDGSADHGVDTTKCKEERVILLVRLMHPDMTAEHYKGHERTMFEEIPPEYRDGSAVLEQQAEVLQSLCNRVESVGCEDLLGPIWSYIPPPIPTKITVDVSYRLPASISPYGCDCAVNLIRRLIVATVRSDSGVVVLVYPLQSVGGDRELREEDLTTLFEVPDVCSSRCYGDYFHFTSIVDDRNVYRRLLMDVSKPFDKIPFVGAMLPAGGSRQACFGVGRSSRILYVLFEGSTAFQPVLTLPESVTGGNFGMGNSVVNDSIVEDGKVTHVAYVRDGRICLWRRGADGVEETIESSDRGAHSCRFLPSTDAQIYVGLFQLDEHQATTDTHAFFVYNLMEDCFLSGPLLIGGVDFINTYHIESDWSMYVVGWHYDDENGDPSYKVLSAQLELE